MASRKLVLSLCSVDDGNKAQRFFCFKDLYTNMFIRLVASSRRKIDLPVYYAMIKPRPKLLSGLASAAAIAAATLPIKSHTPSGVRRLLIFGHHA
ncbi:hypothetical protein KCP69_22070 [Salmonella enterica subsp. enterica]|nr:hypothetical protein KCP69_22070 [Salmonella enterica subsp. enterica]